MEKGPLGVFVAQRRKSLGYSQSDLALSIHYTNQSISSFEKGGTSPSISVLPSLADFLHLSLDDLIEQNEAPSSFEGSNPAFNDNQIQKNLIALRRSKGYSQSEEGRLLGVSRRTIIHYESGTSIPSLDVLYDLLATYQIKCSVFFYDTLDTKLTPLPKASISAKGKMISLFVAGFLVGAGLLSAILVPLGTFGGNKSSSSAPYQTQSSDVSSNSSTSSESEIPSLSNLYVITTTGQGYSASLTVMNNVANSLTLTLFAEGGFAFTETTKSAYSLSWSLSAGNKATTGVSIADATPYPCQTLTADGTAEKGLVVDVDCTLQSLAHPERRFKAVSLSVTIYKNT